MIAGTDRFYSEVSKVFSAAKRNAPAVIFIADAAVIFAGGKKHGLCRYLLTRME